METTDSLIRLTADRAAEALVDALGSCETPEQAHQLATGVLCAVAGAAGGILTPNRFVPAKDHPADLLDTLADTLRLKVSGPIFRGTLHGKTIGTLVAMIERRDTEISGLKDVIASQAEVIARQEQELERRAGTERSGDV